ncbi:MAG: AAA-like domain-containing protein [Clostridiales bacterium]|nr:AAA-like domain-containing protein [Clostridiales bacterium]
MFKILHNIYNNITVDVKRLVVIISNVPGIPNEGGVKMRRFNVTGLCVPSHDYMVDISGKLEKIMELIGDGSYFTINRARQFGKTTTINMIEKTLPEQYTAISISFEGLGDESFTSPETFCQTFLELVQDALEFSKIDSEYKTGWFDDQVTTFKKLSRHITKMCKDKKLVLMIDEVDKTSNNRVFLHFLGVLRDKFLLRRKSKDFTFHSVILAGVYDIKNIKLKMINEGTYLPSPEENKLYNSPWNIAIDFEVDMSFCPHEIATMLTLYEADHHSGMDIADISNEIFNYTDGYPYLVSRICKHIDEKLGQNWTPDGVLNAVKILLAEKNTLFDDMIKNLENNPELHDLMYSILIKGEARKFVANDLLIDFGAMFGFLKNNGGKAAVSNKIFELVMADYFISKEARSKVNKRINGVLQHDVVKDGRFDMELCLRKFAMHYAEIFNRHDYEFLESHGRLLFLSYLTPLINGQGFYHIESQFTDLRRMDLVVDFGREQFIIELKLWRGEHKHEEAYGQLLGYLRSKNASTGYLLTFDFRKEGKKSPRAEWADVGDRRIFDVVV